MQEPQSRGGLAPVVGGLALVGVMAAGWATVQVATASPPEAGPSPPAVTLKQVIETAGAMAREKSGQPQAAVRVVEAHEVRWASSALGCPGPGQSYLDVLTPGYLVVLEIDGQAYRYHAGRAGAPFLCPEGRSEPPAGRPDDVAY